MSINIPPSPAHGVFISHLVRYARACSSYGRFILRAVRLSNKLLWQEYVKECLKTSLRKFYGRYGDLTKQNEVPSPECYTTFWWITIYSDTLHQLLTLLLIWTLLPNLTFYMITRGFHITFATGAACQHRTLTLPGTWSCPIWDLQMVFLFESTDTQSFITPPIHDRFPDLTPNRIWHLSLNWHYQLMTIYQIWLLTELDITEERLQGSICNWCGMLLGDAYSSRHLVLSNFGTWVCSNVETNPSWTCLRTLELRTSLCTSVLFNDGWNDIRLLGMTKSAFSIFPVDVNFSTIMGL